MCSSAAMMIAVAMALVVTSDAQKHPLYIAMRFDDIQYGWLEDVQKGVVDWAVNNNVKMNFGIISGPNGDGIVWPTNCANNPQEQGCDNVAVKAINDVYQAGKIKGKGSEGAILEIFNHAYNHTQWPDMKDGARHRDLQASSEALSKAYPLADIKTFVPPRDIADAGVVKAMKSHNLSIVSSMGAMECDPRPAATWHGTSPKWNYNYIPCQPVGPWGSDPYFCTPENDIYFTTDRQAIKTADNMYTLPTGSANSNNVNVEQGLTAKQTLGIDKCGCETDDQGNEGALCYVIPNAKLNAKKSNGVLWTVMMMHPQTTFPHGQSYTDWLDDFLRECRNLDDYDVRFVHFQDLAPVLKPSGPTPTAPTPAPPGPTPTPAPAQPTPAPPPPSPKKHGTHHVVQGDYCGKIAVEECGQGTVCNSATDCPAICNSATVCPALQAGQDVKFDCSLKGTYC